MAELLRAALMRLATAGAGLVAAVTALTLLASQWWIADLFTSFRVQYVVAGAAVALLALALRRRAAVVAALAAIAVNLSGAGLLPALVDGAAGGAAASAPEPATAAQIGAGGGRPPTVRFVSANVYAGNDDPAGLLRLIETEQPDILLVLEHTFVFRDALRAFSERYPYRLIGTSLDQFGIALYSRFPLRDGQVAPLGETDAVIATIDVHGSALRFVGVHLLPPMTPAWAASRNRQLAAVAALAAATDGAVLVCGDLNVTPWSPQFARFVEDSKLETVAARPLSWTWPAGMLPLGVRIDHCFRRGGIATSIAAALGDIGSDHYPLAVEFAMDDMQ